jgi:hypothetical protein
MARLFWISPRRTRSIFRTCASIRIFRSRAIAGSAAWRSRAAKRLMPSCATKVWEGMEVQTESERVKRSRYMNLELIFRRAYREMRDLSCGALNVRLLEAVKKYGLKINRFRDRKGAFARLTNSITPSR